MNTIHAVIKNIKQRRLLFSQILFTIIAFTLMVVFSYYYTSGIVYEGLSRYAESVFSSAQAQIEYDLFHSEESLGAFAIAARTMIKNGGGIDSVRTLTYDMADHFHRTKTGGIYPDDIVEDLFVYVEAFDGEPVVISGFGWVFPDNVVPADRVWYQTAEKSGTDITVTPPYISLRSGELVITYVQAFFDDTGNRLGMAGLSIQVDQIGQNIVNVALGRGGYGMLLSPDLVIIAHANHDFIGRHIGDPVLPLTFFAEELLAGKDVAEDTFYNWLGEETTIYVRQLPSGWYLGLLTPRGLFYENVDNMMLILSLLGTMFALALIFILIQIDRAKVKASDESRQKSVFLANMSHEIRTPLNAVIGLSELILETKEWNEENQYRVEQIISAGETLLSMVNDILDISKIESGKFELINAKYDIPSIINDASSQSILHKGDKPIKFVLDITDDMQAHLFGDELRIKQILNNLLSNAFKYTMEGMVELTIRSERDGDDIWLTFSVSDTGIGIKHEKLTGLFHDYTQLDMEANRKIVGTGLGLSITKRLAEHMNGKITVESEYGKGSVFTARVLQKYVDDEIIGTDVANSLKEFHYIENRRRGFESLTRINLPYARVLIVDDVVTNLDVAKGLMKPYHMQIDCVTTGWEAVEAMHNENIHYSAIFMDHMMPVMDGVEATRLIREIGTKYAKNIPIIALTANAIVGNEEMFLEKGFQAFVSKPIEITKLDTVIREWVRNKEQEELYMRSGMAGIRRGTDKEQQDEVDYALFEDGISGLDLTGGLKRFGGDKSAYLTVLRSFVRNIPPLLESAESAFKIDNLSGYETIVHGIKGSAGSINAQELTDMASALENAAYIGDINYISNNHAKFIAAAKKFISDINAVLTKIDKRKEKPKKDKPDSDLLDKLSKACINYEMDIADNILEELETYEYETGNELIIWLRENVDQTNFDEIAAKLGEK